MRCNSRVRIVLLNARIINLEMKSKIYKTMVNLQYWLVMRGSYFLPKPCKVGKIFIIFDKRLPIQDSWSQMSFNSVDSHSQTFQPLLWFEICAEAQRDEKRLTCCCSDQKSSISQVMCYRRPSNSEYRQRERSEKPRLDDLICLKPSFMVGICDQICCVVMLGTLRITGA